MRSVFIVTDVTDREKVIDFLDNNCDQTFVTRDRQQWNIFKDEDGLFYIYEISADELFSELEGKTYFNRLDRGCKKYACWQIDISGRHAGTAEIKRLLGVLLSEFDAYAVDDYTNYFWTLHEIDNDVLVEGHTFFDHVGWYDSRR